MPNPRQHRTPEPPEAQVDVWDEATQTWVDPTTGEPTQRSAPPAGTRATALATTARENDLRIIESMIPEANFADSDPQAAYRAMITRLFRLENLEDIFIPKEAVSADEVVGRPMLVTGWTLQESDYDTGSANYVSLEVTFLDTDEPGVVNTGWQYVLGQMLAWTVGVEVKRAQAEGRPVVRDYSREQVLDPPLRLTVIKAKKPNKHGKYPLRLAAVK